MIPESDKTYKLSIAPPDFECSICCDYKNGDPVIETDCEHFFHLDCMDRWNEINNNCPLCRSIQSMCDKLAVEELMNKVRLQIKIHILQSWWKEIEGKSLDELRVLSAELQEVVSVLNSTPEVD